VSLPIALDTNTLARLLTNDDPLQVRPVADLIEASPACFVPITVVLELEWVLRGAYQLPRASIIRFFRGLIAIRHLHLDQQRQQSLGEIFIKKQPRAHGPGLTPWRCW
jgi:predicted nucleic-acid-binding protein